MTRLRLVTSPAVVEEPARPATLDRAVEVVLGTVRPLGPALVPLPSVRGLVLAEKVTAEHDLPTSTSPGTVSTLLATGGPGVVRPAGLMTRLRLVTSPAVVEEPARPATLDRAVEVVLGTVRPLGPALVPLPSVRGLVLAEKATAEHDLPTSTNGLEGSPIGVERAAR